MTDLTWFGWMLIMIYIFAAASHIVMIGENVPITRSGAVARLMTSAIFIFLIVNVGTNQ